MAKALKAAGDTEFAKIVQRLKRPTIAMWGVLAAAASPDDVRELVTVSHDLLAAHDGGDRATILELTKRRRAALATVVRAAVDSLRPVRAVGDRGGRRCGRSPTNCSRHPELMQSWIDGVLRDVPEADGLAGILEFAAPARPAANSPAGPTPVESTAPTAPDQPTADAPRPERRLKSVPSERPDGARTGESGTEALERQRAAAERRRAEEREARNARAARAVATREARRDVDIAVKALAAAQRRVDAAEATVREAEAALRALEADRDAAVQRHYIAADRLANLTD